MFYQFVWIGFAISMISACSEDEPLVSSSLMCAFGNRESNLSIMTYNTHLFEMGGVATRVPFLKDVLSDTVELVLDGAPPVHFLDEERAQMIAKRISEMDKRPDIIVLTEVWDVDIANDLIRRLSVLYPSHFFPDAQPDVFEGKALGSGLILLSHFPLYTDSATFTAFEKLQAEDAATTKGVGQVSIQVCKGPRVTVFMTHTQATYKDESGHEKEDVTLGNIAQMGRIIQKHRERNPLDGILIVGDFNIADSGGSYKAMIETLQAADAFREVHADATTGFTYDQATNPLTRRFYGEMERVPLRQRLDYILYCTNGPIDRPKLVSGDKLNQQFSFIDTTSKVSLPLSDHYPLMVQFALR
jgi:endonuclease/exonuclease/phosphatase family metal-dependent hydrolase